jgi:hypothetical protein
MLCLLAAVGLTTMMGFEIAAGAITAQKNDSKDNNIISIPMISLNKSLWNPSDLTDFHGGYGSLLFSMLNQKKDELTPMDALDMVREIYAANFEKVLGEPEEEYYYKLPFADYYLVYEGAPEDEKYLIHLYEFVLDDPDTGIGHTVTYGWYTVDKATGIITDQTQP